MSESLFKNNLHTVGKARLSAVEEDVLDELLVLYGTLLGIDASNVPDKTGKVDKLLEMKAVVKQSPPKQTNNPSAPLKSVFKPARPKTTLATWNAQKLKILDASMGHVYDELASFFKDYSIVCLSEVPFQDKKAGMQRVDAFMKRMNDSGAHFAHAISDPCGPGNLESHLIVYDTRLFSVKSQQTHTKAGGVSLCHAPFTVHFQRVGSNLPGVVVTSVHFPPNSNALRRGQRDAQIKAFLSSYAREAGMRLNTPFTQKGAADSRQALPIHIVAGDFNASKAVLTALGAEENGFGALLGDKVSTSTTATSALDNVLVDSENLNGMCFSFDVIELADCRVSDHSIVTTSAN
jgi:endonuclease/exonuclease/phosphatase family metal-dependent hydrolase